MTSAGATSGAEYEPFEAAAASTDGDDKVMNEVTSVVKVLKDSSQPLSEHEVMVTTEVFGTTVVTSPDSTTLAPSVVIDDSSAAAVVNGQ